MKLFALPEDARFKNKEIILFILPIFFEQVIIALMGIIDTYMVSHLGETAVAGVSLALSIDKFVKNVSIALATGGSVVVSQYIGARNIKEASRALKTNIQVIFLISTIACIFLVAFRDIFLSFLFGTVEEEVMNSSKEFFSITALSYPFLALYNCGSASFRATGNTRIPFTAPLVRMYGLSEEATGYAINILYAYFFMTALFYPLSFALPNALRGTGDTVFTMTVSALSMFLFRIIMAYVFVYVFKTGVIAIWYAMVLDWIIRSLAFVLRYKSGKWEKIMLYNLFLTIFCQVYYNVICW